MSWVGTAVLGGAAVSGAASIYGANQDANAQTSAANQAAATQMAMFQAAQRNLAPYREAGAADLTTLQGQLPFLTSPIKMDEATLEQTPGYQFTKTQGLKAVQNSAAARGLGVSGAALKGAATFATGLADQTYQTQFNLENINRSNAFNRLKALIDTGAGAAAGTGTAGLITGQGVAGSQMAAGNAAAAGYNAYGAAGSGIGNAATTYGLYQGLYGPGGRYAAPPAAAPQGPIPIGESP